MVGMGGATQGDCCDQRFSKSSNLNSHLKIHTEEKPSQCDWCGQQFFQRGHLKMKTHLRIHSGENPSKCDFCEKKFNSLTNAILEGIYLFILEKSPSNVNIVKRNSPKKSSSVIVVTMGFHEELKPNKNKKRSFTPASSSTC